MLIWQANILTWIGKNSESCVKTSYALLRCSRILLWYCHIQLRSAFPGFFRQTNLKKNDVSRRKFNLCSGCLIVPMCIGRWYVRVLYSRSSYSQPLCFSELRRYKKQCARLGRSQNKSTVFNYDSKFNMQSRDVSLVEVPKRHAMLTTQV